MAFSNIVFIELNEGDACCEHASNLAAYASNVANYSCNLAVWTSNMSPWGFATGVAPRSDVPEVGSTTYKPATVLTTSCNVSIGSPGYVDHNLNINAGDTKQASIGVYSSTNAYIGLMSGLVMDPILNQGSSKKVSPSIGFGYNLPLRWVHGEGSTALELMRLTHDGKLGIGTQDPTELLHVNGPMIASAYNGPSDARLKEDIIPADIDICYNNVKQLPLKYYKWRDEIVEELHMDDIHKVGWIAQEVEEIYPNAVKKKEMMGISDCRVFNPDQIYASLYGAVQKLMQIAEAAEARATAQDAVIAALTARLDAMS